MSKDILNNDTLYSNTNVLDSVKIAYHKLCNPCSQSFDFGNAQLRQVITPPESRPLEPLGSFDLGGFFFWTVKIKFLVVVLAVI